MRGVRSKTKPAKSHPLVGIGWGFCTGAVLGPCLGYAHRIFYRASLPEELQQMTRGAALSVQDLLATCFVLLVGLSVGVPLIRIGRRMARNAEPVAVRPCSECGYELAGLDQPRRCPECSAETVPNLIPIPGRGTQTAKAGPDLTGPSSGELSR